MCGYHFIIKQSQEELVVQLLGLFRPVLTGLMSPPFEPGWTDNLICRSVGFFRCLMTRDNISSPISFPWHRSCLYFTVHG